MGQVERLRQNNVPIRYQTDGLERVLGNVSPRHNEVLTQRRTGEITGGQDASAKVSVKNILNTPKDRPSHGHV